MPLTSKGRKIKSAMVKQYGAEKGKQVFYASENKGTITGVKKGNGTYGTKSRKGRTSKGKKPVRKGKKKASRRR